MTPDMRQTPEVLFARDVARLLHHCIIRRPYNYLATKSPKNVFSFIISGPAGLVILLLSFGLQEGLAIFKLA